MRSVFFENGFFERFCISKKLVEGASHSEPLRRSGFQSLSDTSRFASSRSSFSRKIHCARKLEVLCRSSSPRQHGARSNTRCSGSKCSRPLETSPPPSKSVKQSAKSLAYSRATTLTEENHDEIMQRNGKERDTRSNAASLDWQWFCDGTAE